MSRVKPQQMACVTIGYIDFLLPADKAMKVLPLLQEAVRCQEAYEERSEVFRVDPDPMRLEIKLIRADQVRMPQGAVPTPQRRLT